MLATPMNVKEASVTLYRGLLVEGDFLVPSTFKTWRFFF